MRRNVALGLICGTIMLVAGSAAAQTWNTPSGTMTTTAAVGVKMPDTTTTPKQALQVDGSVVLNNDQNSTGLNNAYFIFNQSPSTGWWNYNYGMTLGFNNSRWRTLIFAPDAADIAFSTHVGGSTPTGQSSFTERLTIAGNSGNVGINVAAPSALLDMYSGDSNAGHIFLGAWDAGTAYNRLTLNGLTGQANYNFVSSNGDENLYINRPSGKAIYFREGNDYSTASGQVIIAAGGAVTISGSAHVVGNLTVDGTVNHATYNDIAEWVPSTKPLPPGTVVVLDASDTNQVKQSEHAYDTAVAGVVSAAPGFVLGSSSDTKSQIATLGRVRVKVDATKHPVHVGDLLVTSDKAGMAMVSEPIDVGGTKIHRPGTLIGKALEPLAGGTGDVLVLLSLQ